MSQDAVEQLALELQRSDARIEIVKELAKRHGRGGGEYPVRPKDLLDPVMERAGTSDSNVYQNLKELTDDNIIRRRETSGRATVYELTDEGKQVVEHLGLSGPADEEGDTEATASGADESGGDQVVLVGGDDTDAFDPAREAQAVASESHADQEAFLEAFASRTDLSAKRMQEALNRGLK